MKRAYWTYSDKWKEEIERYLGLLTDKLDDDKVEWVAKSQTKWEEFIDANDEFEMQCYIQYHGRGSIISEFMAYSRYNQYRERALFLERRYKGIEDTVKNDKRLIL